MLLNVEATLAGLRVQREQDLALLCLILGATCDLCTPAELADRFRVAGESAEEWRKTLDARAGGTRRAALLADNAARMAPSFARVLEQFADHQGTDDAQA